MMKKRAKFTQILTYVVFFLIIVEIAVYITLSAVGVLDNANNDLDKIFAIITPIALIGWSFILIKNIEYRTIFKELRRENLVNFNNADSTFNNFNLFKKSTFGVLRKNLKNQQYYMIVFTPCSQEVSSNLTKNENVTKYNGLIAEYLEDYFNKNKVNAYFDSTCCFTRNAFVVLVLGTEERIRNMLEELELKIYQIAKDNEIRLFVQPYFGIAEFKKGDSFEEIFEQALLAKIQSERNFEPVTYYDESLITGTKLSDTEDIMEGIKNKEFEVYYQPKFSLNTKQFISSEALVRWNSSKYGFLNPSQFIDKVEKAGLIHEIDMYVFNRVCENINDANRRGRRLIPVSINFSMYEFYSPTFVADILKCVDGHNVPHNLIEIEITETTSQSNPFLCISIMKQIKEKGFRILMDDFGTGYSNFSNLRKVPIDCLKIDKSFIDDIVEDKKTREIVRFLIELGKNNELEVIAEGVDKAEQVDILRRFKLDTIQGYYYSKPLPKKDYEDFLISNKFEKKGEDEEWF